MNIRLICITLKNFKGFKEFKLQTDGKNVTVKGDNATGKSSLADGFLWLLFDKDSNNSSKFSVKPMDVNGNEIHFLETEAEAELIVDGKPLKLKKVLTENWVKPRGQEQQEYKGNETTYFFDEVPVKKTVYMQKVAEMIDEETFKLLTSPLYFNDEKAFPWNKRRIKLFEVCGNMKDEEIIAYSDKLAKLPEVLDGKTVAGRTTIIKSSISKLNSEIEAISPKINENKRLIPEVNADYSETEKELAGLKLELRGIENLLSDAGNIANAYREKQRELFVLNSKLRDAKIRIDSTLNSGSNVLSDEKQQLLNQKYSLENEINRAKQTIDNNSRQINLSSAERQRLIGEWKELDASLKQLQASGFEHLGDTGFSCPTCGQDLPEEAKEQKLSEMRTNFDNNKTSGIRQIEIKIAANVSSGKGIKSGIEILQSSIVNCEDNIAIAKSKLADIEIRLGEIEQELSQPTPTPDYSSDFEYAELTDKIEKLQAELNKPVEDTTSEIRLQKQNIQLKIDNCNTILNNRDVVSNAKARIEELKQQEKELAGQKSKLEGHLFLIELFIRTKADMLSATINNRFKHVRFKLFDQLQNGGISETCETLVNTNGCWVPYSDGNTAGKINAGLDVINSLIDFYGVSAPIMVDNAESVTDLAPTKAQLIRLVKPEIVTEQDLQKYSRLVVEVEG